MKSKVKILSIAVIIAVILSIVVNIAAANPRTNSRAGARLNQARNEQFAQSMPRHHGPGERGNPVEMIIRMGERLELTEDQIASLEAIPVPDPETVKEERKALSDLRKELNAAIHDGNVEAVTDIVAQISDYTLTSSIEKAQLFAQIKEVLTDEQEEMLAQFSQRIQMRGRQGRPGRPEGFGPGGERPENAPAPETEEDFAE